MLLAALAGCDLSLADSQSSCRSYAQQLATCYILCATACYSCGSESALFQFVNTMMSMYKGLGCYGCPTPNITPWFHKPVYTV